MFPQTELNKELLHYFDLYKKNGIKIDFNFQLESEHFSKNEKWEVLIDNKNNFKISIGPKILFSDGKDLRTYDNRTNQIFIQNFDSSIINLINYYINENYISSLDIKEKKSNNFFVKTDKFEISIEKDNSSYNCVINEQNNLIKITNLHILLNTDSNFFKINKPDAFIIDMRSN